MAQALDQNWKVVAQWFVAPVLQEIFIFTLHLVVCTYIGVQCYFFVIVMTFQDIAIYIQPSRLPASNVEAVNCRCESDADIPDAQACIVVLWGI